jgi:hypothetical protein
VSLVTRIVSVNISLLQASHEKNHRIHATERKSKPLCFFNSHQAIIANTYKFPIKFYAEECQTKTTNNWLTMYYFTAIFDELIYLYNFFRHQYMYNLLFLLSLFFTFFKPVSAMDVDPEPVLPLSHEDAVTEIIELLESNVRVFEIASKLAFDVAHRYQKGKAHDELMLQAQRWMGSAINFGKEHNWPIGLREDTVWIGINMARASTYWAHMSAHSRAAINYLKAYGFNENILKSIARDLYQRVTQRKPLNKYEPQDAGEIKKYGEYPPIDHEGLMFGPWRNIVSKITALLKEHGSQIATSSTAQDTKTVSNSETASQPIDAIYSAYNSASCNAIKEIDEADNKFNQASLWYLEWYRLQSGSDGGSAYYPEVVTNLLKINNLAQRKKTVFTKIELASSSYEKLLRGLSEALKPQQATKGVDKTDEKQAEKKNKPTKRKVNKGKKKPKSKAKNKPKKPTKTAKESDDEGEVEDLEADEDIGDPEDAVQESVVSSGAQSKIVSTSNAVVDKPSTQNTSTAQRNPYRKMKPQPIAKPAVLAAPATPQYNLAANRFLAKEVVELFLDVFGNKQGDVRQKNGRIYQRQGWGTIDQFEKVLKKAGWLVNQRETSSGVVNEKHGSSTISFRMPNSGKNVVAPIIKFHDDHKVKQDMREITRNFIVSSLEYFGYTEDFLEQYYTAHFLN